MQQECKIIVLETKEFTDHRVYWGWNPGGCPAKGHAEKGAGK